LCEVETWGTDTHVRQSTPSLNIMSFCMMPGEHFKAGYTVEGSTWGCHTWYQSSLTIDRICFISTKEELYVRYKDFLVE